MPQINLRAGDLVVDIQSEEDESEELASLAREIQDWQMDKWMRADLSLREKYDGYHCAK